MSETTVILCTIKTEDMKKINKIVKNVNADKSSWQRKANRQAVIRALVNWALKQELTFDSRYSKEVTVRKKII